ncbi:hypothetical protein J32TS2_06440 [Shouchella clausii]|nr:hypothetical protein J1TS1_11350 [Shouchella clausii]GIN15288.1 hypothetical protein J32TS2_06440 [Shouchella clausii]
MPNENTYVEIVQGSLNQSNPVVENAANGVEATNKIVAWIASYGGRNMKMTRLFVIVLFTIIIPF